MIVYLAGPITGATYEGATDWREDLALNLPRGTVGVSPMRGKEYLKKMEGGLPSVLKDGTLPMSSAKAIFARDTFDIRRAEIVLANLTGAERVSVGTMVELGYAKALNKTIIIVMEEKGNVHDHPFVTEAASFVVRDLSEALRLIGSLV
jgi:nucleoside 2-deoxyribosyltransferase